MARNVKIRQLVCPDCGATMRLKYPAHGPAFYSCVRFPSCRGSHLARADGSPVGIPADAQTRKARADAHRALDTLWQNGRRTRSQAYALVAGLVGHPVHLGSLDLGQCLSVIAAVEEYLGDHPEERPVA
jgi:ssDNA-binding Zn-finger/Zn-ribbon topoisomerase 1